MESLNCVPYDMIKKDFLKEAPVGELMLTMKYQSANVYLHGTSNTLLLV